MIYSNAARNSSTDTASYHQINEDIFITQITLNIDQAIALDIDQNTVFSLEVSILEACWWPLLLTLKIWFYHPVDQNGNAIIHNKK